VGAAGQVCGLKKQYRQVGLHAVQLYSHQVSVLSKQYRPTGLQSLEALRAKWICKKSSGKCEHGVGRQVLEEPILVGDATNVGHESVELVSVEPVPAGGAKN